jgi:hypothetical protein
LLLLHLVDCLYYCISDARSHKHQINKENSEYEADQVFRGFSNTIPTSDIANCNGHTNLSFFTRFDATGNLGRIY